MTDLPTGTVTLLFTDIEGSTRLLHELGERYAEVLAEHRRVLREAFAAHGGVEVDTQGDAFFVAFARASDGLAAAEAAQRALEGGPVRVRMGLHTGEPTVTEEGYVGADVHLAARVMGAGHGGQVLVSEATARLVEAELRDLGEHRLKDIERPVRLCQAGEGRFPPLKTLNNANLPLPQTPLLGRKKELADVLRLLRLQRARLVTVTGPGGIGKTRFALEAAHELVEEFAHGVWFVDLSALRDPVLVLPTIAATLGAKVELADHVADKHLLLVLDNFEQVVDAARDVAELLRRCANVQLLVTSREALHVTGERAFRLRPLAESPAVELFRERAEAADPDFEAPWETLTAIVERLDRLPLAIELAATRVNALRPDELLRRLEQRLPLLSSRARDLPERQRTLRAAIQWSHELLDEGEKQLFAHLAVFAGGFTLEAAQQACDADLETLESLVDKSLVRRSDERFTMLETIREFAAERLEQSSEAGSVAHRHAAYFLDLFERCDDARRARRQTLIDYIGLVRREQDNARRALAWYRAARDVGRAARLAGVLHPLWMASVVEGRRVLDDVLADEDLPDDVRGRALRSAWTVARAQGDVTSQRHFLDEAVPLFAQLGDRRSLAEALLSLAGVALRERQLRRAREVLSEGERVAAEIGDRTMLRAAASLRAHISLYQGDFVRARLLFEEELEASRGADDSAGVKLALVNLGLVALEQRRLAEAAALLRESLAIRVEVTHSGDDVAIEGLAAIAVARGDLGTAARLLGATETWRAEVGAGQEPFEATIRDRAATAARSALGDGAFRALAQEGAALRLDDAIELAMATVD